MTQTNAEWVKEREGAGLDPALRFPARWNDDPGGWERHARQLADQARLTRPRVVFLGDSITQGWGAEGLTEWESRFAALPAANLGIGGDRTQNLLWRIVEGGALDGVHPELAVVLIGVNNLWHDVHRCGPALVAGGIAACAAAVRDDCPNTKVLAVGILPTQTDPRHPLRAIVREVNAATAALLPASDGAVRFVDIGAAFLEPDGTISTRVMHDACHLTAHGYRLFAESIEPAFQEMLR